MDEKPDLKAMSVEELKALKRRWFEEAVKDGRVQRMDRIARTLGKRTQSVYPKWLWERENLVIFVDDHGDYMTAKFDGHTVCNTHYCEGLYVPGPWEAIVNRHHPAAMEARLDAEEAAEEAERQRLLRELGGQ